MSRQLRRAGKTLRPRSVRLRCESFEERVTPALFNVHSPLTYTGLNNNGCVAVADFNHDGFDDAVFTNYGSSAGSGDGNSITILYGRADGLFNRVAIPTGGTNVSFVSVGDINSDGWADLVATNGNQQNAGTVSVFQNTSGNLSLAGTPIPTGSNNPCWVGLSDVTGDNVLDIVVASFGKQTGPDTLAGNNITIFQGNADGQGHGNFTYSNGPITTLAPEVQFSPLALAVADFDGDGIKDIAAAVPGVPLDFGEPQPDGSIYLFKGTGSAGFTLASQLDTGGAVPINVQAADLNGDGKKDLIIANAGDPNSSPEFAGKSIGVMLNISTSGNPTFGIPTSLTANTYGPFATAIADFDMNGTMDIAAVNYGGQLGSPTSFVSIYMGNGQGGFATGNPGTYDTLSTLPGGQYLAVGDFDHNSSPDLIVAQASNRVGLLLNTTAAAAAPRITGTQVNGGEQQRSRVTSLTVTFNAQVSFASTANAAFTLTRNSDGAPVTFTATASVVGGVTVVTINNFGGSATQFGSLADGRYTLTALANQITAGGIQLDGNGDGQGGDNYTFGDPQGLFRYYGDVNGDRHIDIADFGVFSTTYGLHTGQTGFLSYMDFNNDGVIDIADFGQFAIRMFTMLP